MKSEHHVIIVPGLGNGITRHQFATNYWKMFGIIPHIFDAKWTIEEPLFEPKLQKALTLVDDLTSTKYRVSLLGNSAGSSFVLNIFEKRKQHIHKVIINCGRVRTGDWPWFTFNQATSTSPSFKESVLRSEKIISSLSANDKEKILTLRPIFDEVVPPTTVPIIGAVNMITPSLEHSISIALNMTIFSNTIRKFIQH
jgi:hypothetical protein